MMLKSVDLPQPDGPMTPTNSPCRTSSETVSSACTSPSCVMNRLLRRSTSSSGRAVAAAADAAPSSVTLMSRRAGARDRRRGGLVVAGLDPHIDDRDLSLGCGAHRLVERRTEIAEPRHRAEPGGALRPGDHGKIDLRP